MKTFQKATMQERTAQRDDKDGTPTFRKQVDSTEGIGDLMAQDTSIRDMLAIFMTLKEDRGYLATVKEPKAPGGDGIKSPNKKNGVHSTPEGDKLSMHGPRGKIPMSSTPSRDVLSVWQSQS